MEIIPKGTFQDLDILSGYTPENNPSETFYVPVLERAIAYDRAVGYWSAAELKYAAQGVSHFLANGGRMRLVVGAQLSQGDVDAVIAGEPIGEMLVRKLLSDPGLSGVQIVQNQLLGVLAWMVKDGRLEIRVGVPESADGRLLTHQESGQYFHMKTGILTDAVGNKIAFEGSNNASVTAWERGYESFSAFPSWLSQDVWKWSGQRIADQFERLWNGSPDPGWRVIDLPLAVQKHLIENAPEFPPFPFHRDFVSDPIQIIYEPEPEPEPEVLERPEFDEAAFTAAWDDLVALRDAPLSDQWVAAGTAEVSPLPHQALLVDRVVRTFPRSYLLADEVGLGKTVEAGLVIRELLLSGKAKSALMLVPASVLRQWQEELHEKLNLDVPRYDGGQFYSRDGQIITPPSEAGNNPWSAFPIVLATSNLARRRGRRAELLAAGPWDIVLVDEAHHARRRGSKSTDTPNSLLMLLNEMKARGAWKALYLASATPMQMNPHEAWDLINLLGLQGDWGGSADNFMRYFENLRAGDNPQMRDWRLLAKMLGDFYADPAHEKDAILEEEVQDALGFVDAGSVVNMDEQPPSKEMINEMPNEYSKWAEKWLRRHNPMRDRVFRNTRQTLRAYQAAGIIPPDVIIPTRQVHDEFIPLAPNERKLYDRIEEYIRRHYNQYMGSTGKAKKAQNALGFIMTVYRRRLTSSFAAITKSLARRLDVLENNHSLAELIAEDDYSDAEGATLFDPDEFDISADLLSNEISELRAFVEDLRQITAEDTKASKLIAEINAATLDGHRSIVVFTQYTDTMDYIRERLLAADITKIGCYSGRGGEVWDTDLSGWRSVSKSEIKALFTTGQLQVLIGTDAMSEGLNLQTSSRLINYDMPWNLMRVEQRIGRVGRIGASHHLIDASNYFYADTVEERVYHGIKDDFGDFTNIIGDAAPVLANVEKRIEQLALGQSNPIAIAGAVSDIKSEVDQLGKRAIQNDDFGTQSTTTPPALVGSVTLPDLEQKLLTNTLTAPLFQPTDYPDTYLLTLPGGLVEYSGGFRAGVPRPGDYLDPQGDEVLVTFSREIADAAEDEITLLTYGTPELEALLPRITTTEEME